MLLIFDSFVFGDLWFICIAKGVRKCVPKLDSVDFGFLLYHTLAGVKRDLFNLKKVLQPKNHVFLKHSQVAYKSEDYLVFSTLLIPV